MVTKNRIPTGKVMEMIYHSKSGQITKRKVKVITDSEHRLVGYCFLRKHVRTFKKNQILAIFPYTNAFYQHTS